MKIYFSSFTILVFIIVNLATIYTALYPTELKPKTTNLEMESTKEGPPIVERVVKTNGSLQHNKKSIVTLLYLALIL